MKKRKLQSLRLNKKPVSNLNALVVKGGRNSYDNTCHYNAYNMGCTQSVEDKPDMYTSYYPNEEGGGVPTYCGSEVF
ncbi:MAG: hypothetical protein AAF617_08965 [Bacteroidota bacterium]